VFSDVSTARSRSTRRSPRFRVAAAFCVVLLASPLQVLAEPPPLPAVQSGRIERLVDFPSRHVPSRPIDVWLPIGYPAQAPYAVLYMHDGQMLFDAAITWNKQEWRVDEVAGELIKRERVRPFIVVGIWNAGDERASEYFPQRPLDWLEPAQREALLATPYGDGGRLFGAPVRSDAYLRFLVEELKPYVEAHFEVSPKRDDTFVAGSSLGALISLYALAEYPQVFGGAICMSTHWPGRVGDAPDNPVPAVFLRYIAERFPAAGAHRIWFDHGTKTLDASYADRQREVDELLRAKGYARSRWQTRTYAGAEHSETAWAARLDQPLLFLLRKPETR